MQAQQIYQYQLHSKKEISQSENHKGLEMIEKSEYNEDSINNKLRKHKG